MVCKMIDAELSQVESPGGVQPLINPLEDTYSHVSFLGNSDSVLYSYAQRVHAEGYINMNIVQTSALTPKGTLEDANHEYRGNNVEYYLTFDPSNATDAATLRKISLPSGADHNYLPAYRHTRCSLSEEGMNLVESLPNQETRLKEISAMARTSASKPLSIFETLRHVFRQSLGKDEVWFCSLLVPTYDTLERNFGEHCFQPIGSDVTIRDGKANPELTFRPVLFQPDLCLSNMLRDYLNAQDNARGAKILRSFMYFNYRIDDNLKDPEVASFYHEMFDSLFTANV